MERSPAGEGNEDATRKCGLESGGSSARYGVDIASRRRSRQGRSGRGGPAIRRGTEIAPAGQLRRLAPPYGESAEMGGGPVAAQSGVAERPHPRRPRRPDVGELVTDVGRRTPGDA